MTPAVVRPLVLFLAAWIAATPATAQTAAPPCALAAAGSQARQLQTGRFGVTWYTDPAAIEVGRPFRLLATFCRREADPVEAVRIDALMPEHGHGMNYKPTVGLDAAGRLVAEGMVFHMPGRWHLTFAITGAGLTDNAAAVVVLE